MGNGSDWGIAVVLWLQQFSPALDWPFRILTFLGDEPFFLLLLPFIYWSVDGRSGARLILLFLFSAYLNALAKVIADQPRPFAVDPRVQALVAAGGGGFPSGHTQHAVVVWGFLGLRQRHPGFRVAAGLLILGIPLSRLYLGVHFPVDLLGGYVIGLILLGLFERLAPAGEAWLAAKGLGAQLALAAGIPLLLTATAAAISSVAVSAGATLLGMAPGFVLERRFVAFGVSGSWSRRALRFLLGGSVLFLLWAGLKVVFQDLEPQLGFRVLRYALVGFWGAFGAPLVFARTGLAPRES